MRHNHNSKSVWTLAALLLGAISLVPQTAFAGATLVSGNAQLVLEQFLANQPMLMQVTDASGNPAANVPVTWSVTPLIGTITAHSSTVTDANGMASCIFLGSGIQPGFSFQEATITGSTSLGSVNFIATIVSNHSFNGGLQPPPAAILLTPPQDNRHISGRAGSTLPSAVVVQVIAQAGLQLGTPIPDIGVRIAEPQTDPTVTTPPPPTTIASCLGPAGLTLTDANGMAHCDLVLGNTPGTYALVGVTGELQNTATFILEITPGAPCAYLLVPSSQTALVGGGAATIGVNTTAGCGWTAQSNAPWITVNGTANGIGNGSVSISIAANALPDPRTGTVTIGGQTYTVNQTGTSGTAALAITTTSPLPSATVNGAYSAPLSAVGGKQPYTWTSSGSLPPGILLNATTGVLGGTPTAAGIFNFSATVSDSANASAVQTFSLTVTSTGGGGGVGPFAIATASVAPGVIGKSYQQVFATSGGCASNPFAQTTFAITAGSLPAGLTLQQTAQGGYAIAGTPTVAGTSNFTVTATDSCGTKASASFLLTVTATAPSGPSLGAAPGSLTFNVQTGSSTSPATQPINITSSGAAVSFTATASTSSGGNWLTVSAANGTTPGALNIGVSNFANLAAGTYNGTVVIASPQAANSPITVTVNLVVGGTIITASPQALTFNYTIGSSAPAAQALTITSSGVPVNFTTTASTTSGGNWLIAGAANGTTPTSVNISASNLANLGPGTYNGSVVIASAQAANSPVTIPVTLNVIASANIVISPQALTFNYTLGSSATPASQTIQVTSGATAHLGISSNTFIAPNWLSVTPSLADTPATLTVAVTTGGLAVGSYSGLVLISVQGASPNTQTVPVTLNILAPPTASANPQSLTFSAMTGAPAPSPQTVAVTSSVPLNVNVASVTTSGGNWLTFSPGGGATPLSVSITATPGSLGAGTYQGTVTISSADSGLPLVAIAVTLTVTPAAPTVLSITNAANFIPGAVAPGEIVTLFGSNLGPAALVTNTIVNGFLGTITAGTRVLFDGIPAPILYASGNLVSAIVPYAVAGRVTVNLVAEVQGVQSSPISLRVADSSPGIFVLNASGQGAVLNQDFSVNSPGNLATQNSVISVFATGEGATTPTGVDGKIASDVQNLPQPRLPVTATVGGLPAKVTYAGAAPGLTAGVLQVNVQIPSGLSTDVKQALVIKVNGNPSQDGVYVAVRPQQ
ncbi:MAG: putative Ig domain-containing protein [Acidobacteriota bacterium]|nr:putative Ig domain-containing protein [Acidobacteriota bacterium]